MVNLSSNEEGFFDLRTERVVVPMVNPSSYGGGLVMETVCVPKAMAGRCCGMAVGRYLLVTGYFGSTSNVLCGTLYDQNGYNIEQQAEPLKVPSLA